MGSFLPYADAANNFADGSGYYESDRQFHFLLFLHLFDLCAAAIVTVHSTVDHAAADTFWVVELLQLCCYFLFFFSLPLPVVPNLMD